MENYKEENQVDEYDYDIQFWKLSKEDYELQRRNNLIFFGRAVIDIEIAKDGFKQKNI